MLYSFIIFFVLWYGAAFFQSTFLHRYATHKSFELSPVMKRLFGIFAYLFLGASYMAAMVYASMHTQHHIHTDKKDDPHSPKNENNIIKFMWMMYKSFNKHFEALIPPLFPLQFKNPLWWERLLSCLPVKLIWVALYLWTYYTLSGSITLTLILTLITSLQGPIQGFLVNWFGHGGKIAKPQNIFKIDLLLMGEAYHENHHADQKSVNFSKNKVGIDISYVILRIFSGLKLVRMS